MVQLNPIPVFGAQKNDSTIWRKFFFLNFRSNSKFS